MQSRGAAFLAIAFVAASLASCSDVRAIGFSVLATFPGGESAQPIGNLAYDGQYIYGTTSPNRVNSVGTVFRVAANGTGLTTLHQMVYYIGGYQPVGGVTLVGSKIYGTTYQGGPPASGSSLVGSGTLFSMNLDGSNYQLNYVFGQQATPKFPSSTVIYDGTRFYGTTAVNGGATAIDVAVYTVKPDGSGFQLLHAFSGADGQVPAASLTRIGSTLYGTTIGRDQPGKLGSIFNVDSDGSNFHVLHSFTGSDGAWAGSPLLQLGSQLYGTTFKGGVNNVGTIFSINLDGSGFHTIYSFSTSSGGNQPLAGLTLLGSRLYGTTTHGGAANDGNVFSIKPDGTDYQVIHTFTGADGAYPNSTLLAVGSTLYGTAQFGGVANNGTAFAVTVPEPSSVIAIAVGAIFVLAARTRQQL